MKLLIVDDQSYNRDLLRFIMEDEGHECIDAEDGVQALSQLEHHQDIDVVLMDVNMPNMDGIEATRRITAKDKAQRVAIIFITALDDDSVLSRCLNAGGDDFIPKPINESILIAKVNANYRSINNQKKLAEANKKLDEFNSQVKNDHDIVESVFENIKSLAPTRIENIKTYTSPMSMFNGDIILSCASPSGGAYFLLGDFTGHGLPAAIGSLPVMSIFYNSAKRQCSISEIAQEINNQLHKVLPTGLFLCATIGYINKNGDQVSLWSGGMNDAVLFNKSDLSIKLIEGEHMPLGIHEKGEFNNSIQVYTVNKNNILYFYSDGINEAQNDKLDLFGDERVYDIIRNQYQNSSYCPTKKIVSEVEVFSGTSEQRDDISILEVSCLPCIHRNITNNDVLSPEKVTYKVDCFPWSLDIAICKDDLKSIDVINQVSEFLGTIPQVERHKDKLFTIISELYNNALEHGVLGLSSDIKDSPQGFEKYYELRDQKLDEITDEFINIKLEYIKSKHNFIKIQVIDSGAGFLTKDTSHSSEESSLTHGRGISLIKELSSSLEYINDGRHAIACYQFDV